MIVSASRRLSIVATGAVAAMVVNWMAVGAAADADGGRASDAAPASAPAGFGVRQPDIRPAPSPGDVDRSGAGRTVSTSGVVSSVVSCSQPACAASRLRARRTSSYRPRLSGRLSGTGSPLSYTIDVDTFGGDPVYQASGQARSGQRVSARLPVGSVRTGATYDWSINTCSGESCARSEEQPFTVDPLLGAGDRSFFTERTLNIGDRLRARINIGTGNLEVALDDLALPSVSGKLALTQTYSSLSQAPGSTATGGSAGAGWRLPLGPDVTAQRTAGGSVRYTGAGGFVALFTGNPRAGRPYTSPAGIDATLVEATRGPCAGQLRLTFHHSGRRQCFDSQGRLTAQLDRNGNAVGIAYDGAGRVSSLTGTAGTGPGNVVVFDYAANGKVSQLTQTDGDTTRTVGLSYDGAGNLMSVTDATGGTMSFGYDAQHLLTSLTDPAGTVTTFGYDDRARLTEITRDSGGLRATTSLSYASGSTALTDADGHATHYQVDYAGRITQSSDPLGRVRSTTWSADAKAATATRAGGGVTTNTYGANNGESLTASTGPTGAAIAVSYPDTSTLTRYRPASVTDPAGNMASYRYQGPGNLLSTTDATAAKASVTYRGDGTVATSTDPANQASGNATRYHYSHHQLAGITPPSGNSLDATQIGYDGFGRPSMVTTGNGVAITYTHDAADRLTGVSYSDGTPSVTFDYGPNGNVVHRSGPAGTTDYGYDALGRLTSQTGPGGADLAYGYDPAGNLTGLTDSRGTTSYAYDAADELNRLVEGKTGNMDRFAHNADGLRTDTWANVAGGEPPTSFALHIHSAFDSAGHLTRITTARDGSGGPAVADLSYDYTAPGGQPTDTRYAVTNHRTHTTTNYGYDPAGRLTSATGGAHSYGYSYDADGNITGGSLGSHLYNSANQRRANGVRYDADGNQTRAPHVGRLTYNGADQTSSIDAVNPDGPPTTVGFGYAGTGQAERTNAGPTSFVNGLLGVQSQTAGGATTYFARDNAGTLIAEQTPTGEYYYATDGLGSTIALIDASGNLIDRYAYTPYGRTVDGPDNPAGKANPYRFAGGYHDTVTGLYHFGDRYYNPKAGTWTQQDSITNLANPANGNRYAYTGDNPTNYLDPNGHNAVSDFFTKTIPDAFTSHTAECLEVDIAGLGGSVVFVAASLGTGGALAVAAGLLGGSTLAAGVGVANSANGCSDVIGDIFAG